nr:BppU family phage baseplate upper protein [uncultured Ruminococcus sp.]
MNDYIAEITLDLNCERSCKTVMLTQFDKGKKIHLSVTANGSPYPVSGCSVVMKGINSDGSRVAVNCEVEQDGTATAVTDDITFAVKGFAAARFVISDSQRTYNTQRFLIYVDDALDTDVTSDPSYSILNRLIRQVRLIDEHGGIIVDDELSTTSTHPVQNRVVNAALNEKAPAATAFTFDSTTTNVTYNANNPKIIYLNATVDGESGIVLTSANNSCQYFFGGSKSVKIRNKNGASSYTDWEPASEKVGNKKNSITSSNKSSTEFYPSIKAIVDYLAANYEALSNKLDSETGIDGDSTDTQYPTAKAVYDFGGEIVDLVNEDISDVESSLSDLKTYIGYTSGDILGLQADFENKRFTRLGAAVGKNAGSDFNVFPMYGQRRRVAVDSDGVIDDSIVVETVTSGDYDIDVMVYQPKFYYKVVPLKLGKQSGGLGYHIRKANYYISSTPHAGFKVHPLFIDKNGSEVDYVLFSAYEASYFHNEAGNYYYFHDGADTGTSIDWSHDELKSVPGVKPISGQYKAITKANMENLALRKSVNNANWHLDTIQSVSANQLLMAIEYGAFNLQNAIGKGIVSCTDVNGVNVSSLTGSTKALGNATGAAEETVYDNAGGQTVNTTNGKVAVSYRGMENPWGNIFKHVNGINIWGDGSINGGQAYIAGDYSFDESRRGENYKPSGFTLSNGGGWISSFGYGAESFDWLFLTSEVNENGANSAAPVGDNCYVTSNLSENRIAAFGGDWHNGDSAGGFFESCIYSVGAKSSRIGGRLLFVPTAAV